VIAAQLTDRLRHQGKHLPVGHRHARASTVVVVVTGAKEITPCVDAADVVARGGQGDEIGGEYPGDPAMGPYPQELACRPERVRTARGAWSGHLHGEGRG